MTSGNRPEGNTGAGKLYFPFHYGRESESYAFYRIPKILFRSDVFKQLSIDAKLLYGMLLDRMELSSRNEWIDEEGKVYIYFTRQSVMEIMDCGSKKAGQLLAELDGKTGIGLITRVRQGLGKPDRIYVRKCITPGMQISPVVLGGLILFVAGCLIYTITRQAWSQTFLLVLIEAAVMGITIGTGIIESLVNAALMGIANI